MSLNYIDIILLVPLAIGLVRGLFKGFIKEVFGLLAIVLGILVSYFYADDLAAYLRTSFENAGSWLDILSYLITFSLTALAINLLAKYLTNLSKLMALGLINRLVGGLFGFLKVLLIFMLIIHLFGPWLENLRKQSPEWQKSKVYELIYDYSFIPGSLFEQAAEKIEEQEFDFPTLETP